MLTRTDEKPDWFAPATEAVLQEADVLLAAAGPRELEEATVRLLGQQLRRAVRECSNGWFDWWLAELTDAAADRARDELQRGGAGWEAPRRLLHGLASVATPSLAANAVTAARGLVQDRGGIPTRPTWLADLAEVAATGEVWRLRDAYGSRLAVIAGFAYPGGTDPSFFLFDVDACGAIMVVNSGCYDDVTQAADAWRALAGESADGAEPQRVDTAQELLGLFHAERDELYIVGDESDSALDNWFRATRRFYDLAEALDQRGLPLPVAESLFENIDETPSAAAFTAWYTVRHGQPPEDAEAVEALAHEWLEGCLPGAQHAASPHRVRYFRELMSDWRDDPITVVAKALLPEWVHWNCEQAGVSEHLTALSVGAAEGEQKEYSRHGSACAP